MDKPADLEDRLVDFAVRIIHVVEALPSSKAGHHVAGQLIRFGTAPAPNLFKSLSCYFTNQQSSIVNHQSNERACKCLQRRVKG